MFIDSYQTWLIQAYGKHRRMRRKQYAKSQSIPHLSQHSGTDVTSFICRAYPALQAIGG